MFVIPDQVRDDDGRVWIDARFGLVRGPFVRLHRVARHGRPPPEPA